MSGRPSGYLEACSSMSGWNRAGQGLGRPLAQAQGSGDDQGAQLQGLGARIREVQGDTGQLARGLVTHFAPTVSPRYLAASWLLTSQAGLSPMSARPESMASCPQASLPALALLCLA